MKNVIKRDQTASQVETDNKKLGTGTGIYHMKKKIEQWPWIYENCNSQTKTSPHR